MYPETIEEPGMLLLRIDAPLYFANVQVSTRACRCVCVVCWGGWACVCVRMCERACMFMCVHGLGKPACIGVHAYVSG